MNQKARKYVLFGAMILIALSLCSIFWFRYERVEAATLSVSNTITKPFKIFFQSIGLFFHNVFSVNQLYYRNLDLQNQLNDLNSLILTEESLSQENELLKTSLQLKNASSTSFEEANVLFSDPEGLSGVIVIDKGLNQGLQEGMNVIWKNKILVGQIIKVSADHSKVKTFYAPGLKLGAEDFRSRVLGLAESSDNGVFYFRLLPKDSDIKISDLIITSIENTQFMKGLALGEISEIQDTNSSSNKTAKIRLPFRLTDLSQVLIIKSPIH